MPHIEPIKIGWRKLGDWLNSKLVPAVNSLTPVAGPGIDIESFESGTMISLTPKTIKAEDDLTARVAALEAIILNSAWGSVDVMDSACNRSTIQVLIKTDG